MRCSFISQLRGMNKIGIIQDRLFLMIQLPTNFLDRLLPLTLNCNKLYSIMSAIAGIGCIFQSFTMYRSQFITIVVGFTILCEYGTATNYHLITRSESKFCSGARFVELTVESSFPRTTFLFDYDGELEFTYTIKYWFFFTFLIKNQAFHR